MEGGDDPDNRRDFPELRTPEQSATYEHVKKLLHLRRDMEALRRGRLVNLMANDKAYLYARVSQDMSAVVAMGAGGTADASQLGIAEGTRQSDWLGSGATAHVSSGRIEVTGPGLFLFKR